jgi:hypothetical protein
MVGAYEFRSHGLGGLAHFDFGANHGGQESGTGRLRKRFGFLGRFAKYGKAIGNLGFTDAIADDPGDGHHQELPGGFFGDAEGVVEKDDKGLGHCHQEAP